MMPVLGSRRDGLELAQELFRNAGLVEGRILVLTDGIKNVSEISDFRNAAFPISIIGIGTENGGAIPINRPNEAPRFLTDEMGGRVIARLNESLLIQAAQQSYGRYSLLTIGDADFAPPWAHRCRQKTPPSKSSGNSTFGPIWAFGCVCP